MTIKIGIFRGNMGNITNESGKSSLTDLYG